MGVEKLSKFFQNNLSKNRMSNEFEKSKKEIVKLINSFYSKSNRDIFKDFVFLSSVAIKNKFAYDQNLEDEYLRIIKKYTEKEINKFSQMLWIMINGITERFWDFLWELFMELEQGNKNLGQFFTPYNISRFMSQILFTDRLKEIQEKGFITLQEPSSWAGGMIISSAEVMKNEWYNYQKTLYVEATDLDETAFYMCFLQLSLYGIVARVIHWNTLTQEKFKVFYTPMYYINKLKGEKIAKIRELFKK